MSSLRSYIPGYELTDILGGCHILGSLCDECDIQQTLRRSHITLNFHVIGKMASARMSYSVYTQQLPSEYIFPITSYSASRGLRSKKTKCNYSHEQLHL